MSTRSETFTEELMELIRKRFPGSLSGDVKRHAEATAALTIAIGGMVAFAYRLNGEVLGRTALQEVIKGIVKNAADIDQKAAEQIRKDLPSLLLH